MSLSVPNAGNCGEDTNLTCVGGYVGYWVVNSQTFVMDGSSIAPEDISKYSEIKDSSSTILTIHNTDITDEGYYRCCIRYFDRSLSKHLNIECKE